MSADAQDLARTLAALVAQGQAQLEALALVGGKTLPPAAARSPINSTTGIGAIRGNASGTAGIASPLTEPAAETRTYYGTSIVTSTDGIFTLVVQNLHTIDLLDGRGGPVQIIFDNP